MAISTVAPIVGVGAVAAVLLAGAVQIEAAREARYPPREADPQVLYVRSGALARRLAGAYAPLAADLYWIRAIQYFGGHKARQGPVAPGESYDLLYPLLDLTTSLDPRFNIAYRFGAIFLSEPFPNGAGRPDLAIKLLEKGLRERPDKWEYLQDIGFVHYWYDRDYRAAAEAFNRAAEMPRAPWWLRSLAATTLAKGGDRQSSRLMWEAILQSAEVDFQRRDAEHRLRQFHALDEIDALQRAVDEYARRSGARPADWSALVRAGVLRGIPIDPTGEPYGLGTDGRVRLSNASKLGPLPAEDAGSDSRPPA
jgi:tetratricopeptide (TPR) repeat protein